MEQNETGCKAPPDIPVLCANNCGCFGSVTTMNLCTKCHKESQLKQEQAKLVASSIGSIVNVGRPSTTNESVSAVAVTEGAKCGLTLSMVIATQTSCASAMNLSNDKVKGKPNRCSSCNKRVGLTGFNCRCGSLFCAVHRYSDKHGCLYDYQTAARDAIAKANPVVKAAKLDKSKSPCLIRSLQ